MPSKKDEARIKKFGDLKNWNKVAGDGDVQILRFGSVNSFCVYMPKVRNPYSTNPGEVLYYFSAQDEWHLEKGVWAGSSRPAMYEIVKVVKEQEERDKIPF